MILVERILNRNDGIILHVPSVQFGQFFVRQPRRLVRIRVLKVKIVFPVFEELGRSHVHPDFDFPGVTSLRDGLVNQHQCVVIVRDVGGKTTFIADRSRVQTIPRVDNFFQVVVDLKYKVSNQTTKY